MKVDKKIDWLSVTQNYDSMDSLAPILPVWLDLAEPSQPPARFTQAWKLDPVGLLAHSAANTMCNMLLLTGSDLATLRDKSNVSDDDILQHFCKVSTYVTRLDYAVDVMETDASPLDILELWKSKQLLTTFRTVRNYETLTGLGGQTVYFGSKSSAQQIRIYDKAAEQKLLHEAWVRVELQARKKKATPLAQDMVNYGIHSAGDTRLRELLGFGKVPDWWRLSVDAPNVPLTPTPRPDSQWQKWLSGQVLDSIRKHAVSPDDRAFLRHWIEKVDAAILDGYKTHSDAVI